MTFEDIVLGEQLIPSLPWAIKLKISSGFIQNVTFRRIRIGRVGDTPWMYPDDKASAFMLNFFDQNRSAPKTWVQGLTFEDITVAGAKSIGHLTGPGSCLRGLTMRNVTVEGSGKWTGCGNVESSSSAIEDVVPQLTCGGCM